MQYAPAAYDSLPSLRKARELFNQSNASQQLHGPIRQLFLNHDVHDIFGMALLHRHFSIGPAERLVDYKQSATAWHVGCENASTIPKYGGFVVPRAIRWINQRPCPYEFAFSESPVSLDGYEKFLRELANMLEELNLQEILGLRMLESHDSSRNVEVTEKTTNIMIPKGCVPETELIEALWKCGLMEDDRCDCREYCIQTRGGEHEEYHGCF